MTIRDSIKEYLKNNPGRSAFIISEDLEFQFSSVSSLLKRMTDSGELERKPHLGPRNGFGYFLIREK